ncbi:MAG TPA: CocE/NonD family hydrolase [Streptosporangiaceae bacterium]|nr:CocE/NonD family hydrolase [Streptosporangiaceae bacterium]
MEAGRGTEAGRGAGGGPGGGRVSRRAILRAGALGGGAAAALGAGGAAAARASAVAGGRALEAGSGGVAGARFPPIALFAQEDLNFETLFALGSAGYGTAEVGEIVTVVNEINARGATYQAYYDGFAGMARRVAALAAGELAAGHKVSARSAYLRAATYYDLCLFFVLGTSFRAHEAAVYASMQHNWNAATQLFDPPFEFVHIPYGDSWLPAYFLRPDSSGVARPTVILNNGSDGQNVDLFAFGGAAALERGYNALIFEGPGQGSMLFERQIFFRPNWEHVVTPIIDWLTAQPDVDDSRIAITGWSMCGESVIRAAAFEHRLTAVVADPGVRDAWLAFPAFLQKLFTGGASKAAVNHIWNTEIAPHMNAQERFTFAKRSELFGQQYLTDARAGRVFTDLYDLGKTIMAVNCTSTASKVTSPTLVNDYVDDQFYPGQAREVYDLLPANLPRAFHTFTVAEGAEYHDAPMAPQTRNQVVFDWLDDILS